ncbi:hypothetical protein J1614_001019 [Plenodomus biglobosus]|nr:hypothetical protein J1614_001019 [Plenodomus biglobosus]
MLAPRCLGEIVQCCSAILPNEMALRQGPSSNHHDVWSTGSSMDMRSDVLIAQTRLQTPRQTRRSLSYTFLAQAFFSFSSVISPFFTLAHYTAILIMKLTTAFALALATISRAIAQDTFILGFNSGASDDKGNAKSQADFEKEFRTAKELEGAPGNFSAIRLYSNVQWETTDTPINAFAAAVATNTRLLLGIWTSGTNSIDNELKALEAAIEEHGTRLTDLIIGLSVGSEDLYRDSEPGRRNKAGVGNTADAIIRFIRTTRERLANTALSNIKITHVDTWTAWVNGSNKAVVDEVDFVSVNNFPFYQSEQDNRIGNAAELMSSAIAATEAVAGGKDVWITETGWAYTGPDFGAATATVDNAASYWRDVGCALFGKYNIFWYTLRDANPANQVKFAITDDLSTQPRFNLSCPERNDLPDTPPANLTDVINSPNDTSSGNGSSQGNTGGTTGGTTGSTAAGNNTGAASSVSAHSTTMILSAIVAIAIWAM